MSAIPTSTVQSSQRPAPGALLLLLGVGALLAISVVLSKIAAGLGAPMLTYLAIAMGGSGLILTAMNGGIPKPASGLAAFVTYSFVAGGLMALGSALGYLTVHKVGAAFISLALAFPPMLTWLISLVLRMERFDALRVGGLLIGLAGGVLLAVGKGIGAPSDIGAILVACAMPAVLAAGNVYRTRYWPKGARAGELAGAMLVCGAILILPFAIYSEGVARTAELLHPPMLLVVAAALATFVAQYAAFFRLQQIAGPVYLSQIGSVAAVVGSPVAVLALGETLPAGFVLAALLIVAGLALFQYRAAQMR